MSQTSQKRSEDFLKISDQFQLGGLTTESSHPVTSKLSDVTKQDISAALGLLFQVDQDVLRKYRDFAQSGRAAAIKDTLVHALRNGGRMFFTGCGSTGRLSIQLVSIWRDFWQRQRARDLKCSPPPQDLEERAVAVMAGGDFALIKAVEGFEDFTAFGKKQMADLAVSNKDVVFAITEGGETSFVIGTAWKGVEVGAKVYFVYNNPDDILCRQVKRSREVIEDSRIEKLNLTTGPMAITGSTRMQATSIQLAVLLTFLEMVLRDLMKLLEPRGMYVLDAQIVPAEFLAKLTEMLTTLKSPALLSQLARLVSLEETTYRAGHKSTYFANRLGIDVLTDTTERAPTYCTPPFRKFDDPAASDSWAFLCVPYADSQTAWERLIKRKPKCVDWSPQEVQVLVGDQQAPLTSETVRRISYHELMRFKIGLEGLTYRPLGKNDCAIGILMEEERSSLMSPTGFVYGQLETARKSGARHGLIYFGHEGSLKDVSDFVSRSDHDGVSVLVALPKTDFLLDGVTRVGVKMLLNALSTCTMVRLGRVMGNFMIWVVASNLKLIDRATRYIEKLTSLPYNEANRLLFEVMEYVEPRMKSDQAYPPVVGLAVTRMKHGVGNKEAEQRLMANVAVDVRRL
jgi:N-acetylmuramic acid 6-phosphate etherase